MKKAVSLILVFAFMVSLFSPIVLSQEGRFDFERAYQDYSYNYGVYRRAHNDYILARGQYLTYQTLKSKTNAQGMTLKMLQARDEAVITYLTAIRLKLVETDGVSDFEKEVLFTRIDAEVEWYKGHKSSLPSAGSLEDLVESSREAEGRYKSTEVLLYQALTAILVGKENGFRIELSGIIEEVKAKVAEIRQNQDKNTRKVERWILESENRLTRSQEKQFSAQDEVSRLKERERNKYKSYNEAQSRIKESHQYLKEASSFLKEIVDDLKTQDLEL